MFTDPSKDIPNLSSAGSEWLQWYKDLRSNFSKSDANTVFLKAWKKQGTTDANTMDLRAYLSKNGIDLEKGIFSSIADTGEGIISSISSTLSVGKYVVYAVTGIAVVGLGIAIFNIARDPGKFAGVAAKAAI